MEQLETAPKRLIESCAESSAKRLRFDHASLFLKADHVEVVVGVDVLCLPLGVLAYFPSLQKKIGCLGDERRLVLHLPNELSQFGAAALEVLLKDAMCKYLGKVTSALWRQCADWSPAVWRRADLEPAKHDGKLFDAEGFRAFNMSLDLLILACFFEMPDSFVVLFLDAVRLTLPDRPAEIKRLMNVASIPGLSERCKWKVWLNAALEEVAGTPNHSPNLDFFADLVSLDLEELLLVPEVHVDHLLCFGESYQDKLNTQFVDTLVKHICYRWSELRSKKGLAFLLRNVSPSSHFTQELTLASGSSFGMLGSGIKVSPDDGTVVSVTQTFIQEAMKPVKAGWVVKKLNGKNYSETLHDVDYSGHLVVRSDTHIIFEVPFRKLILDQVYPALPYGINIPVPVVLKVCSNSEQADFCQLLANELEKGNEFGTVTAAFLECLHQGTRSIVVEALMRGIKQLKWHVLPGDLYGALSSEEQQLFRNALYEHLANHIMSGSSSCRFPYELEKHTLSILDKYWDVFLDHQRRSLMISFVNASSFMPTKRGGGLLIKLAGTFGTRVGRAEVHDWAGIFADHICGKVKMEQYKFIDQGFRNSMLHRPILEAIQGKCTPMVSEKLASALASLPKLAS